MVIFAVCVCPSKTTHRPKLLSEIEQNIVTVEKTMKDVCLISTTTTATSNTGSSSIFLLISIGDHTLNGLAVLLPFLASINLPLSVWLFNSTASILLADFFWYALAYLEAPA